MHFRIFKLIATSGFLAALECTKLIFRRGSATNSTGGAYGTANISSWFKVGPTSRGRGGKEMVGRKVETPLPSIPVYAPVLIIKVHS